MSRIANARGVLGGAALLGLLAGAATMALTRGAWGYTRLPTAAALYLGAPSAALGAALLLASALARSPTTRHLALAAFAPAAFALGILPLAPLGVILERRDVAEARTFCAYLAPEIERHRAEHGRYPEEVASLLRKQTDLPKLIEKGFQYHTDGRTYRLEVVAPGTPHAWHSFESASGRWRLVRD